MTQRRAFEIDTHRGDAELVPFGEKLALPERFEATITPHDPQQPVCHLTIALEDGRPVCTSMTLDRQGASSRITSVNLRVPLSEYVRAAIDHGRIGHRRFAAEGQLTATAGGETLPVYSEPTGDGYRAIPTVGAGDTPDYAEATKRRRRRVIDDALMRKVAATYKAALAAGEGPTQAIAHQEYVSRSTASRWVKEARKAGHLGPATPRRAG